MTDSMLENHPMSVHPEQLALGLALRTTFTMTCMARDCGVTFFAERSTRKFCSDKCRQRNDRDKRNGNASIFTPVARTVHGTNAELLADVARLYIPDGALVADVTYGRGTFWQLAKRERRFTLVGSDIATKATLRADFRQLPYRDESFDVVVLDPPYVGNAHPRMVFNCRYNGASTTPAFNLDEVMMLYRAGMDEARRVLKPRGRLFVKTMDQVENGTQRWAHLEIHEHARTLGMFARDLFILVPTSPPYFKRRRQIHARKSHSFLWVFEGARR